MDEFNEIGYDFEDDGPADFDGNDEKYATDDDDGPALDLDVGDDEGAPVREDFGYFGDENLCGE
jgi:hypothetical protein